MLAKEVMSKKPEYLSPTATLKEAAELMLKHDYGFVPIGDNDRLVGAVTDRDISIRAIAKGKDPNKTQLKDVMTKGIHYCFEEDDLDKVANMMKDHQIRRLVVLNTKKRMTGILSLGDIAIKSKNHDLCAEVTEGVSKH